LEDGRGQNISISEKGKSVRRAMWPIYERVLSERIGAKLKPKDAAQLATLLSRL